MAKHSNPFFSVVMPAYNRGYTIQHAIRSILDQTFRDFELIIVNDGSTDGTERVVQSFEDPRIRYYSIPHSGGHIGKVRNFGIRKAKGELIVVQDSDDMSLPNRLAEIASFYLQYEKPDVMYHDLYVRSHDPYHNAIMWNFRKIGKYDKQKLLQEQYIPGQVAYTKELALAHPYDERITVSDDFQFLIEAALANARFGYIQKGLYEYCVMADSANINGEIDGRRFADTKIIIDILKKKYGLEAVGELKKWDIISGETLKNEIVT